MNSGKLPDKALDLLMQEYADLRDEIKERLKIAFSHVAYAGAVAAFAIPAADKISGWVPGPVPLFIAGAGLLCLLWVAFLNMRWVQHGGAYLQQIEERINAQFGAEVLGWEAYASEVQGRMFLLIPKAPKRNT
jgi:hypothetical protein